MSITLTTITKGMENGPEAIMANLNALLAAIPEDSGWVDASKYLTSNFKVYTNKTFKYRKIGSLVIFRGIVSPTKDITDGSAIPIASGLPFDLGAQDQYSEQPGTGNAIWTAAANSGQLTFERFSNHTNTGAGDFATCKAGAWLALGTVFTLVS